MVMFMHDHVHNLLYRYIPSCGVRNLSYIEGFDNFNYKFYTNDRVNRNAYNKPCDAYILRAMKYEGIECAIIPYSRDKLFDVVYSPFEIERIYGRW